jgi:hypothetical protein
MSSDEAGKGISKGPAIALIARTDIESYMLARDIITRIKVLALHP